MNNLDLTKTKQENPDSKRNLLSHIHIEQLYTYTHTLQKTKVITEKQFLNLLSFLGSFVL